MQRGVQRCASRSVNSATRPSRDGQTEIDRLALAMETIGLGLRMDVHIAACLSPALPGAGGVGLRTFIGGETSKAAGERNVSAGRHLRARPLIAKGSNDGQDRASRRPHERLGICRSRRCPQEHDQPTTEIGHHPQPGAAGQAATDRPDPGRPATSSDHWSRSSLNMKRIEFWRNDATVFAPSTKTNPPLIEEVEIWSKFHVYFACGTPLDIAAFRNRLSISFGAPAADLVLSAGEKRFITRSMIWTNGLHHCHALPAQAKLI